MKKLIRHGVFETNSSSCHSLTINNTTELKDIPRPNENGDIVIMGSDFGWEQETYYDFESKASYIAIYIRDWSNKVDEFRELFENTIKEATQCESVIYEKGFWENEGWDNGSIDHQSVEDNDLDYLFEDIEELKKFLFNSSSYLQTDNDNH